MKSFLAGFLLALFLSQSVKAQTGGNPLVRFPDQFKWKGNGLWPKAEREKLQELHAQSNAENRKLIITDAPEKENVWKQLLENGADSIVVKQQQRFNDFYKIYKIELEIKGGCHCVRM
ncbi:MAG: hypothetical protein U0T73_01985 [Chitinophagales bacterium]